MIEMPPEFEELLADPNIPPLQKDAIRLISISMIGAEIAQRISNAFGMKGIDDDKCASLMWDSINAWMKAWTTTFASRDEAERAIQSVGEQCGVQVMALRGAEAEAWANHGKIVH